MISFGCELPEDGFEELVEFRDVPLCAQYQAEFGTVAYNRELLITSAKVLDDTGNSECRTTWGKLNCGTTEGKFTAWYLFDQMNGNATTAEFVHRFFETFDSKEEINGQLLTERPLARPILDDWRRASGCPGANINGAPAKINWDTVWIDNNNIVRTGQCNLNRNKAPFRLLAAVNRMDVRSGNGSSYDAEVGEGRLVFGFVRFEKPVPNDPLTWKPSDASKPDATLIFEYNLPTSFNAVKSWAQKWHQLYPLNPDNQPKEFAAALQSIIEGFVTEGKNTAPNAMNNKSMIARLRTNEVAFTNTAVWSLREYSLQCLPSNPNCGLNDRFMRPKTVMRTPNKAFHDNQFELFDKYLSNNFSKILQNTHDVPEQIDNIPFLGAESLAHPNYANILGFVWGYDEEDEVVVDVAGSLNPLYVRHMFAINTCIGCHYNETDTVNMMIQNRKKGVSSALANFLTTPIDGAYSVSVEPLSDDPDPVIAEKSTFDFNEPRRRVCEHIHAMKGNIKPLTLPNGKS